MKPEFHLWPKPVVLTEDEVIWSAEIQISGAPTKALWYRIPVEYETWLSPNHDPWGVAVILWAMRCSRVLYIHGTVSLTLFENLHYLQEIWHTWFPHCYHIIPIQVDHLESDVQNHQRKRAMCSFSGGVDSAYTVDRYCRQPGRPWPSTLVAGLMIHGLDIPLNQPQAFHIATQRSQKILSSAGIALVPLVTNWRRVVDVPWEDGFGTAVAAGLMLFQGYCQVGLIASGRSYDRLKMPWGSTPMNDRECSSGRMTIRYDGADRDRLGKLAVLRQWPEALENLRVCWQGANLAENCCRCEKCIRTALALRALGVDRPLCFPAPVSNGQICRLRLRRTALREMIPVYRQARQQGHASGWIWALGWALWLNGWLNRVPWALIRSRIRLLQRSVVNICKPSPKKPCASEPSPK